MYMMTFRIKWLYFIKGQSSVNRFVLSPVGSLWETCKSFISALIPSLRVALTEFQTSSSHLICIRCHHLSAHTPARVISGSLGTVGHLRGTRGCLVFVPRVTQHQALKYCCRLLAGVTTAAESLSVCSSLCNYISRRRDATLVFAGCLLGDCCHQVSNLGIHLAFIPNHCSICLRSFLRRQAGVFH